MQLIGATIKSNEQKKSLWMFINDNVTKLLRGAGLWGVVNFEMLSKLLSANGADEMGFRILSQEICLKRGQRFEIAD